MIHVLSIAFLVILANTAKANSENGYRGDSILTAELAFRSIFSLAFLVLAGLCVIMLVARPGRAPKVYFTLFFATLSRAISTAVTVFNIVIFADGITESQPFIVHTIIAFTVLVNYFCFWSFALFFLSTCLLVRDRQLSLLKVSNSNTAPTAYYAFFALVMVFATVSATYYVVLQAKSYLDSGLTFEEGVRMENISMDLAYTFESLTYLASIFAAGYIIYAYQELRRLRSGDKIIWTLLVTVAPFYLMYVVQGTIVTILTSPVGISLSGFNQTLRAEKMSLASAILTHLFLVCIGCTIVVLGLLRRPWHSGRRTPLIQGFSEASQRQSTELEKHN